MFFWTLFSTSLAVVVTKYMANKVFLFASRATLWGTRTMVEELKTTTAALGAIHKRRCLKIQLVLTPSLVSSHYHVHSIYVACT